MTLKFPWHLAASIFNDFDKIRFYGMMDAEITLHQMRNWMRIRIGSIKFKVLFLVALLFKEGEKCVSVKKKKKIKEKF